MNAEFAGWQRLLELAAPLLHAQRPLRRRRERVTALLRVCAARRAR